MRLILEGTPFRRLRNLGMISVSFLCDGRTIRVIRTCCLGDDERLPRLHTPNIPSFNSPTAFEISV